MLTRLDYKEAEPIEGFFYYGQIFDAYTLISDLVRKAKARIVLIDNYVDDRILKVLDKRADGVKNTVGHGFTSGADCIVSISFGQFVSDSANIENIKG